jgi:aromatic-L-amino-acid/L-tryptophan decarboxylase
MAVVTDGVGAGSWRAGQEEPRVGGGFAFDAGHEEGLDPQDWDAFRALAHRMVDRMIDFQRGARDQPAWRPVAAETEAYFRQPAPRQGRAAEEVYDSFLRHVLPYPTGTYHPRFWGWVGGTGSPLGMMADLLASGMNATAGQFNDAAARVERQVIDWMKEGLGYAPEAGGIVTSGGSVANLIGLAVARDAAGSSEIPAKGVAAAGAGAGLRLYASEQVHSSVVKSAQLLGIGRAGVRLIPVDAHDRMRLEALLAAIVEDRRLGFQPFAVVGNAGTVNTGATDDLDALADLAAEQGLWLHVDGAFGALAALSPKLRPVVKGLERADSIAFDFHKWLYVNYEAGCVLIRDGLAHRRSFNAPASYLDAFPRGTAAQPDPTDSRGPQLSRGFKALKVWMTLSAYGLDTFGRMVEQNVAQARYLARRVDETPALERLAPVPLNIVCFRYAPATVDATRLDEINKEILMRLQERGIAVPSSTRLRGRFALRVAICNQRSRRADFDALVEAAVGIGREVAGEASPAE